MIETERLLIRSWRDADRAPYADMMADAEVASWVGGPYTREEADARMDRNAAALAEHGWGRMAVERRSDGRLIGYCGLMPIDEALPVAPGFEVGWSLVRGAWGQGYAVEAARAVFADGFDRLGLAEIVAFTTTGNVRSLGVMRRMGMVRREDLDFDHPQFPLGHSLCRHLVCVAERP
jgi:RimJ/RimL family protein N-acetyltransferase